MPATWEALNGCYFPPSPHLTERHHCGYALSRQFAPGAEDPSQLGWEVFLPKLVEKV